MAMTMHHVIRNPLEMTDYVKNELLSDVIGVEEFDP